MIKLTSHKQLYSYTIKELEVLRRETVELLNRVDKEICGRNPNGYMKYKYGTAIFDIKDEALKFATMMDGDSGPYHVEEYYV